jgi:hypothetical protein
MSDKIERLKVNFEVTLGGKSVGTFATMQKAKTAANVAETVAQLLNADLKVKIRETVAASEDQKAA